MMFHRKSYEVETLLLPMPPMDSMAWLDDEEEDM